MFYFCKWHVVKMHHSFWIKFELMKLRVILLFQFIETLIY